MRKRNTILNIITSILLRIITIICGFILQKLIIKYYGSNVNGLIASIGQYIKYIVIYEAGISAVIKASLYKPIANNKEKIINKILKSCDIYFKRLSILFLIYILILCLLIPNIIITDFDSIFTISLIIVIAISTFFDYFIGMTYSIYLQAKQKSYIISNIQISTLLLNFIVCIILILLKCNIIYIKLATSIIYVLRPFILKLYVEKNYKLIFKNEDGKYKIEQKWNGFANHAAYVVHNNTDVIILSIFSNVQEISVYSIYYLIINSIRNLVTSLVGGVDALLGDMIAKKETDKLKKSFNLYENLFISIGVIAFTITYILIIPFMSIYMKDITDVNYIRPLFASLMVLSIFIWVVRQPYKDLIESAGHFKQTQYGAILEALLNIVLSLILVTKYGLVGVAIGTLVSITLRTIELMVYSNKVILKRSITEVFKRIISIIIEFLIIILLFNYIFSINITNYLNCVLVAIFILLITLLIVILINYIFYSKEVKNIYRLIINKLK